MKAWASNDLYKYTVDRKNKVPNEIAKNLKKQASGNLDANWNVTLWGGNHARGVLITWPTKTAPFIIIFPSLTAYSQQFPSVVVPGRLWTSRCLKSYDLEKSWLASRLTHPKSLLPSRVEWTYRAPPQNKRELHCALFMCLLCLCVCEREIGEPVLCPKPNYSTLCGGLPGGNEEAKSSVCVCSLFSLHLSVLPTFSPSSLAQRCNLTDHPSR